MQQAIEQLEKALGHLRIVEEKLRDIPQTKRWGRALTQVQYATGRAGVALAILKQEKKE